ncbi:hypothetical protein ACEQPO_07100 [Bacillus sp. SL00103]
MLFQSIIKWKKSQESFTFLSLAVPFFSVQVGFHLIAYEHQEQTLFILLNTRKKRIRRVQKNANDIKQLYNRELTPRPRSILVSVNIVKSFSS